MTTVLAPEYKIIAKAQSFARGELPPENQRSSKLLSRIYREPDAWLDTYSRFKDLSWASEVFLLGLNTAEQDSLKRLLESTGIFGIRLTSVEGYKALAVSGVREHLKVTHEALRSLKQELEGDLKAVIRHDKTGIVVSGYKRGWPFTTYIGPTEFFHKVYVDKLGRFETIDRAIQSRLPQMDELRFALVKVERRMAEIRKTWDCWKAEELVRMRLENLEKFSDTGGALS